MSPMVRQKPASKVYLEVYLAMANRPFQTVKEIEAWKPTKVNGELRSVSSPKGLWVRGQHTGAKKFVARKKFRKRDLTFTIGSTEKVKLASAKRLTDLIGDALKAYSVENIREALISCAGDHTLFEDELRKAKDPAASGMTVDEFMEEWLPIKQASLADGPSRRRPESLYRMHFQPIFGRRPITSLSEGEIFRFFEDIYQKKYPTGSKLRGVMNEAFRNAKSKQIIPRNPIPSGFDLPPRTIKTVHSRTIPYEQIPLFWRRIENSNASAVTKAIILTGIVTALRFRSIQKVTHRYLNLTTGDWLIPAAETPDAPYRNKSGEEFSLQLPPALLAKLNSLLELDSKSQNADHYVFKSPSKADRPISETAVRKCIEASQFDISFHGFRNAFKTWADDHEINERHSKAYLQHSLRGLQKPYERRDSLKARSEIANKFAHYVLNL